MYYRITVVFASWDAEEYGAIGSTEWGEDFASWISEHVVTYLNVDVSSAGSMWNVAASPSLAHLIKQTALDVPHPSVEGKTLWDARFDHGPFFGVDDSMSVVDSELMAAYEIRQKIRNSGTGIGPLGSGSDFIVFIQVSFLIERLILLALFYIVFQRLGVSTRKSL